jgi:hypothetical protein
LIDAQGGAEVSTSKRRRDRAARCGPGAALAPDPERVDHGQEFPSGLGLSRRLKELVEAPLRWGTERGVRDLLGSAVASARFERRVVTEYFLSVDHAVDVFRRYFGPTQHASSPWTRPDLEAIVTVA